MIRVHYIGAGNLQGWANTACGVQAMAEAGGEYRTWSGATIKAVFRDWSAVTCKSCLRNAHAPGGRISALTGNKGEP